MPRDISLSDSKCWNGGHEWVNKSPPDLCAAVDAHDAALEARVASLLVANNDELRNIAQTTKATRANIQEW